MSRRNTPIEELAGGVLCILGPSAVLNAHSEFLQSVFLDCRRQGANLDFKLVAVPAEHDKKTLEEVRDTIMQCGGAVLVFGDTRGDFSKIEQFAHTIGNTCPRPLMLVGMRATKAEKVSHAEDLGLARAYAAQILGCPMVDFVPIVSMEEAQLLDVAVREASSSASSSSSSSSSSVSGNPDLVHTASYSYLRTSPFPMSKTLPEQPVHRRTNTMGVSYHVMHASLMLRGFMTHVNKFKDHRVLARARFMRFSERPPAMEIIKSDMNCHWDDEHMFIPEEDLVFELVREGSNPIGCFLSFYFEIDFKHCERISTRLQEVVEATHEVDKQEEINTVTTRKLTQRAARWMEVELSIPRFEKRREYGIKEAGPINYMSSDIFTVFAIEVLAPAHAGTEWIIFKRYSELLAWKEKLKQLFPRESKAFAKFPAKKWFSHSQDFIESRRIQLERFLRSLVLVRPVLESQIFQSFFQTYMHAPSVKRDKTMRFTKDMLSALHDEIRNLKTEDEKVVINAAPSSSSSSSSVATTASSAAANPAETSKNDGAAMAAASSSVLELPVKKPRNSYASPHRPTVKARLGNGDAAEAINRTIKVEPLFKQAYAEQQKNAKNQTLGVMWGQGLSLAELRFELKVLESCRREELRSLAICYGQNRSELEDLITESESKK